MAGGMVFIRGSGFEDNQADTGGAIFANGSGGQVLDVSGSHFEGNDATGGGAIALVDAGGSINQDDFPR